MMDGHWPGSVIIMLHNARLGFWADVKSGMNDAIYYLLLYKNKMTINENDERNTNIFLLAN